MDGIDISFCRTNGTNKCIIIKEKSYSYSRETQKKLKKLLKYNFKENFFKQSNLMVTNLILKYLKKFIFDFNIEKKTINLIGISGQTIIHLPQKKITIQLGLPKKISNYFKINVVSDFRKKDIELGGQGAPIGAYYHKYLLKKINKNSLIVNLGGVANYSKLYRNNLYSSDIGPSNALSDDIINKKQKKKFDNNGQIASKGKINNSILNKFKKDKFFKKKYPVSLDRNNFHYLINSLQKLPVEDGLATAISFTVFCIKNLINKKINSNINEIILTGGGRKNKFLIKSLKYEIKNIKLSLIDAYGFNGDLIESQMFSYIAVRSIKKLTLSDRNTTGVKKKITGGKLYISS